MVETMGAPIGAMDVMGGFFDRGITPLPELPQTGEFFNEFATEGPIFHQPPLPFDGFNPDVSGGSVFPIEQPGLEVGKPDEKGTFGDDYDVVSEAEDFLKISPQSPAISIPGRVEFEPNIDQLVFDEEIFESLSPGALEPSRPEFLEDQIQPEMVVQEIQSDVAFAKETVYPALKEAGLAETSIIETALVEKYHEKPMRTNRVYRGVGFEFEGNNPLAVVDENAQANRTQAVQNSSGYTLKVEGANKQIGSGFVLAEEFNSSSNGQDPKKKSKPLPTEKNDGSLKELAHYIAKLGVRSLRSLQEAALKYIAEMPGVLFAQRGELVEEKDVERVYGTGLITEKTMKFK